MQEQEPDSGRSADDVAQREADAAAAEAGAIGGRSGNEDLEESERPVAEGGGGVAEGFEQAEADLEENATHGDGQANPLRDAGQPEAELDPATHGEADHVHSTDDEDSREGEAGEAG